MGYLFFAFDFVLLIIVSLKSISGFKEISNGFRWLLAWLCFSSLVILSGYILSLFTLLNNPFAWFGLHLVFLVLSFVFIPYKIILPSFNMHWVWQEIRDIHLSIKVLTLFVVFTAVTTLAFNLFCAAPLGGFAGDALSYHLPRVGFYLQQGSLHTYPTTDHRQTDFPMGAELQLIWGLAYIHDFRLYYVFQWIGIGMAGLAVYLISERMGQKRHQALVITLFWFATPLLWYHAGTIKNDLMIIAYAASAAACLLLMNSRFYSGVVGLGLALGLAFAVKQNALFVAIGLFLAGVYLLFQLKECWRKLWIYSAVVASIVFVLGSFSYLYTVYRIGWPVNPKYREASSSFHISHAIVNHLRLSAEMTDGLALIPKLGYRLTGKEIADPRTPLYNALSNISFFNVFEDRAVWDWSDHESAFKLGRSAYPEFALGTFILIIWGLFRGLWSRNDSYILILNIAIILSSIIQTGVLQWQPMTNLRFYMPIIILAYPMIGLTLDWGTKEFGWLKWGLVVTLLVSLMVPIYINCVYVKNWGRQSAEEIFEHWGSDFEQATVRFVHTLPDNTAIGIPGGLVREYPIMGVDFKRRVVPLPKISDTCRLKHIFEKYQELDLIFLHGIGLDNSCSIPLESVYNSTIMAVWRRNIFNKNT